jgi:hypothetical protein
VTPHASPGLSSAYQAPVWFRHTVSVVVVERVHGRMDAVGHRADAVEFRVERHAAKLGDRLVRLGVFAVSNGKRLAESEVVGR